MDSATLIQQYKSLYAPNPVQLDLERQQRAAEWIAKCLALLHEQEREAQESGV